MEACATAHGWGREFEKLRHEVCLIPQVYVKPFVKRQKNDVADAEAIVEAALRPTMRFVALKTEDQQARAMLLRTRQMFVGQRSQLINAMRGHLAEHGLVAARGPVHLKRLAEAIADNDTALPKSARVLGQVYLEQIEGLNARIAELGVKMRHAAREAGMARCHCVLNSWTRAYSRRNFRFLCP
jgi:transposase